jgi:WD40 repeat protein/serine/threonine protein kinase
VTVTACPVCGDTTLLVVAVDEVPSVFVLATNKLPANGQDATQSIPLPELPAGRNENVAGSGLSSEQAPTVAFTAPFLSEIPQTTPPNTTDTPDPSFSSLVVLLPEPGGLSSPESGGSSSIVPFGIAETAEFAPPLVPGYEIIHEVGRGGMGVVYKARQVSLNRLVALKMILSGSHAGPTERERFKREAEAVAALQNPHIVQIFEIGEANGHPYLALEFVEGGSLAHNLTGEPWDATRAAELIEILARTMQFAHNAGIVHRDLKPGNILLTGKFEIRNPKSEKEDNGLISNFEFRASNLIPKVTDFGLAKRLDETIGDGGTRTGAVMGTPSYIAPEQASGKTRDIGPATDVYALGAILYELLTGRPPFRGETPLETVLQVLNDDPVAPKRLHPHVPRDLETICLKCLSKQPAKRYANANALANDLRRFLNGEPIQARPLSAWGRGVKWSRRHPTLAMLLFVTVAATVAFVSVLSVAYYRLSEAADDVRRQANQAQLARERAENEWDRAETEKKRAEALAAESERRRVDAEREAERTRRAAYALQLAQVAILCERDPLRAAALLEDETRCPKDLRDFTWQYLRRLCQRDDRAYLDHHADDPLRAVAYSPNAMFVATAGDAGSIRLWDSRTGRTWLVLNGHSGAVHGLAFNSDSTVLASAGADHTVRLWVLPVDVLDTARRTMTALPWLQPIVGPLVKVPIIAPTVTLTDAHAGEVTCVAFSPDSRALVSGGRDGVIRWWELGGWRPAPTDVAGLGGPGAIVATQTIAKQSHDARLVWQSREVDAHASGVLCVAFSQNGKLLASGGNDSHARVWTGDGAKLVRVLPRHADVVRAVAVSPDGNTVATTNNGTPPTVRIFNTQTWRESRFFGHTKSIYALAFSDDGQLLASAGFDKAVRLWDAEDGRERGHLVGHTQQVNSLTFAPDRRTIVSAGMDGVAVVWQTNARTHEPEDIMRFTPRDPTGRFTPQSLTAASIGGGGTAVVAADDLGRVRMFAIDYVPPGGKPPPGPPGPLSLTLLPYTTLPRVSARAAATSADGRTFVVAVEAGLLVWQPLPFGRPGQPGAPPRGAFTAPTFVKTPTPVHSVAIDPTGRWLVTADTSAVRRYDMRDIPVTHLHGVDLKGGFVVLSTAGAREVVFHPTREWLAVSVDSGVRIVTRDGEVLADVPSARGSNANIDAIAFDKSGKQFATGDASGLIKLWSLDASGKLSFVLAMPRHTGPVFALAFSPDGRTLASGGDDRAVILWDPVAGRERLSLTGHADRVVDLAFNRDGTALVTVSRDGAVKRWRADVRPTSESEPRLPQPLPGM